MSSVAEKLQRKSQRSAPAKQVRLRLVYVDFWSVVKLSFLVWLVLGIVLVVATILVWTVLWSTGIFDTLDTTFGSVLGGDFTVQSYFGLSRVALFALVVALLNIVIGTVLGAIGALLYNLSVRITGGVLVGFQNN